MTRLASNKRLARVKEPGTEETVIELYPRRGEYADEVPFEGKGP